MLSPIPLGPEAGPPLMSPGDQLLASPLGLTFPSPGLGRTPGAHVVQEGRLSLEMLGIMPEAALAGYVATGILAPLNAEAAVRPRNAGVLKSSSIAQPNPSAGNQQPKLTPPALVTATNEQLNAKDAYAAQLTQTLPEKLAAEAAEIINAAKATLGLSGVDTSRIEGTISAALAADANALAGSLPSLPTLEPQQPQQQRTTATKQVQQPQRASRRVAAKRARDPEADPVDPATLPPPKRVARMEALYDQLRALNDYNIKISTSIRQAKGNLDKLNEENENLWAATAHIGAAMHAAIEERDAQAGEISLLPSLGDEDDEEELEYQHHPLQQQQQHEQMPPSTAGGATTVLVPIVPHTAGRPILTPGTAGFANLFSPSGDDLFAACNMFVSPLDRLAGLTAEKQLRSSLFPETAKKTAAAAGAAGAPSARAANGRKEAQPALSDDKSFSFRL